MTEELLKVPWYLRLLNNAADQESPEAEAIRHIKKQADTIEALQAEVSNLGEGMRACHENYCEAAADRDRYCEALQEIKREVRFGSSGVEKIVGVIVRQALKGTGDE